MSKFSRSFLASLVAVAFLSSAAPPVAASVIVPRSGLQSVAPDFTYGIIKFHPKQLLVAISTQFETIAKFKVLQKGNTKDHFRAKIGCALNVGKRPHVKI